jgi:hypothetical protein
VPTDARGVGVGTECGRVLVGVGVFAARLATGIGTPATVLITAANRATLPIGPTNLHLEPGGRVLISVTAIKRRRWRRQSIRMQPCVLIGATPTRMSCARDGPVRGGILLFLLDSASIPPRMDGRELLPIHWHGHPAIRNENVDGVAGDLDSNRVGPRHLCATVLGGAHQTPGGDMSTRRPVGPPAKRRFAHRSRSRYRCTRLTRSR